MKYKAVLFDLDGTLLDTLEDLGESMNSVLQSFRLPVHELAAYRYFVGDGMENLARRVLPEGYRDRRDMIERCVAAMRQEYGRRWALKTRPYTGIPELLDGLVSMRVRMAILSNKPDDTTKEVVARLLPDWRFERVMGARPSVPKKPDPLGALEIAAEMKLPSGEFLYLGDTNTDMKTAVAAGMFPVGALWGFRTADELEANGARELIAYPDDLLKLL